MTRLLQARRAPAEIMSMVDEIARRERQPASAVKP